MESARIPGQQGAQATHDTRAARAGGKPAAQRDAAGAGAPQDGFSALLAALGGDPALLQDAALLGTDDGGEPADPASLAAASAGDTAAWPVFWNTVPGSALPSSGAVAASSGPQGTLPAGLVGDATGKAPAWSMGTGTLLSSGEVAPDSLVAQTALLDGAADAAQRQGAGAGFMPTAAAGAKGAKAAWQGWSAAAQGDAAGIAAGVPKGAIAEKKMLSDALASAPALATPGTQAGADRREAGGAQMAGSVRQGAADLASLVSAGGQVLPESLNEWRAGARGGESSEASAPHAHGVGGAGEAVADPTLATSDGMGGGADPAPTMAGDDALSEQVAFWVHQKTQNAELTLDRDGQPVEVKVSLSGNEAHVTFRSDQVQTRDALDASVAQLRDLLQREGMVLSGVTVGASGAGDGGAGRESSPGRQGAQHARVQAAATEAVAGTGRAGGTGNRAVDIFV